MFNIFKGADHRFNTILDGLDAASQIAIKERIQGRDEMLEALMHLSDAAEALDLENKPASDLKDLESALFKASKAISKAEGSNE